jgi:hypothetical protein
LKSIDPFHLLWQPTELMDSHGDFPVSVREGGGGQKNCRLSELLKFRATP